MMTMMRLFAIAVFALSSSVDAATRLAVVEIGKAGMVRRTTSNDIDTSPDGVASFWSSLHGYGRKLQHAGMPVVPDLFNRPDSGVVVGITGVDLDTMPQLNAIMSEEEEGENGVVGHMEVAGQHCSTMLRKIDNVATVEPKTIDSVLKAQASEPGISGMKMAVTSETATDVDAQLAADLEALRMDAAKSGISVVIHFIVEEDEGAARRRHLARRLSEDEDEDEEENDENSDEDEDRDEEEDENGNNQNNDGNGNGNNNYNNANNNGFYGYGYYNAYGEWTTPYKTMFQIQYFNVVLWTSIGLIVALLFSIYLMIYMPMMADTLLFGQSAQAVNAE